MRQNIREGIEGKPVDWYSDVFEVLFPNIDAKKTNSLWKSALKKPTREKKAKKSEKAEEEPEEEESDDD